jgi:hypothetical protein
MQKLAQVSSVRIELPAHIEKENGYQGILG